MEPGCPQPESAWCFARGSVDNINVTVVNWGCRKLESFENRILRNREQRNASAATRLVCNSRYSREAIYHSCGIMAHPITLGVDRSRFQCLNLERDGGILSVGGLQFSKGFHLVIDALSQCQAETRLSLTLVANRGEVDVIKCLTEQAHRVGVDLRILDHISDEELLMLHNKAQMVVFVPLMEPFGLVTIEAMAHKS